MKIEILKFNKSSGDRAFFLHRLKSMRIVEGLTVIDIFSILCTNMKTVCKFFKSFPSEALIWVIGLSVLVLLDPVGDTHFTICPFANLGIEFCPGCGLGRSISFLFRGEFLQSFRTHPLGLFAVIILSYRIFQLLKQHLTSHGKSY
jgi:hypothetical protein